FGEARHDRGVEQVPTVGRANDEDLPGGLVESVPLGQEGLHQLGTELVACDAAAGAEYALALVDEQQSRCVLAATLPDFLDPRAGAADVLAFQVGNTYRYEIASLLLRQLARDQCLARARRPEQQHALWGWLATRLEEIHQFEDSVKGLARQRHVGPFAVEPLQCPDPLGDQSLRRVVPLQFLDGQPVPAHQRRVYAGGTNE